MCQYQTCYHDESKGYIIQCEECRRLQMGYGNMMIGFNPQEFEAFCKLVGELYDQPLPAERKHLKYIVIPVPAERIRLLLSRNELNELHSMLEAACNEISARKMMKLFTLKNNGI